MNLQNQIEYLNRVLKLDMFDNCTVPESLDMALVRGAIVMRCGLLTPLFSEPETQRIATQQFFHENQWNFNQIVSVIEAEYNPIENVFEDRKEVEGIARQHSDSVNYGKNTENTISGENVSYYSPDNKIVESGSDGKSGNSNENRTTETHRNGNIGVTSAQSLINETLDLVERLNPYKFIADLYEKELIIGVY